MKTRLATWILVLSLACPLAAQVPLRPPPDTTRHPVWPGAVASEPRHAHPWLGAAVGAAVGATVGGIAVGATAGGTVVGLAGTAVG
jgi:hypothetical protein